MKHSAGGTTMDARQRAVVAGILMVMFLAALDGTIIGTLMPTVISSIGGLSLYPWAPTAFNLASTIATPLYGKLSDLYGHKRFILLAIVIFAIGSALCGMAQSMLQLILFRAIQGIGAGGLLTMSFIMFGVLFPPETRGKMQGLLSSVWGIASVVGPVAGAFFIEALSWRWAFYINIPFGIVAAWIIWVYLKLPETREAPPKVDWVGAALFSSAILFLLYGFLEVGQGPVTPWEIASIVLGVLLTIALILYERKVEDPILPVELFKNPIFTASVSLGFIAGAAVFSTSSFVPLWVQGVLGESAGVAGRVLTSMSIGWVTGATICGRMLNQYGFRTLTVAGSLFMASGFALFATATPETSSWQLTAYNVLLGLGMGFVATTTVLAVQSTAPQRMIGAATSGNQLFRGIGGTLGLAVLGGIQLGIFAIQLRLVQGSSPAPELQQIVAEPHRILDPAVHAALPPDVVGLVSRSLADSIHMVFVLSLLLMAVGVFLAWRMPKGGPVEVASQRS
ncbi:Multidrug resistance protein 3 [compost metagenome]